MMMDSAPMLSAFANVTSTVRDGKLAAWDGGPVVTPALMLTEHVDPGISTLPPAVSVSAADAPPEFEIALVNEVDEHPDVDTADNAFMEKCGTVKTRVSPGANATLSSKVNTNAVGAEVTGLDSVRTL